MAINDNELYALKGKQVKDLAERIKANDVAFKPFPASVDTTHTTEAFMNSILALDAEVGTAFLGTVNLTDLPAGLTQEEVEVYVYSDYVVYCVLRSTDVAPYEWWCASYNYGGWRPVGDASNTIFYANLGETGTSRHIYKDSSMTSAASAQDVLNANIAGQVILRMTTSADPTQFSDAYLQNTYVGQNDYQFLFLDERTYREYDATATTDTTFYYSSTEVQLKLTAGSNINISGNTISATDTTYSDFVGTDGTAVGTAGLVPAPAITDAGKFLKSDGTWANAGGSGPTVYDSTISLTNNGSALDSFTVNASSNKTIALDYPTITMTSTDPGEGSPLAANNFIAVYNAS